MNRGSGPIHASTARVELMVPGALTLKDRRAVVKSLVERLKGRFNLSVSDLDGGENGASRAVIGIAAVSNSMGQASEMAQKAVDFVVEDGRAEVLGVEYQEM